MAKADGIVVLTGGDTRILEGARLLREGHGGRLLISGVNRHTGRQDLIRISGLGEQQLQLLRRHRLQRPQHHRQCRRDAVVGRGHALRHADRRHVQLSHAALHRRAGARTAQHPLIAHPVQPPGFTDGAWWLRPRTARVLASEYLKFLPAAARYAATRVIGPWDESSIAETPASGKPQANI